MKKLYKKLNMLSLILSHLMCLIVGLEYSSMICGIEHKGFSAPAELALISAIPFLVILLVIRIIMFKINKHYNLYNNRQYQGENKI